MQGSMEKPKYCLRYGSHIGRDIIEQHQASPCSNHCPPPPAFKNKKSLLLLERKRISIHITEKHMLLVGAILVTAPWEKTRPGSLWKEIYSSIEESLQLGKPALGDKTLECPMFWYFGGAESRLDQ